MKKCVDCSKQLASNKAKRCNHCNLLHRYRTTDAASRIGKALRLKAHGNVEIVCLNCGKEKSVPYIRRKIRFCSTSCCSKWAWKRKEYREFQVKRLKPIQKQLAKTNRAKKNSISYLRKDGFTVVLDSSWEVVLAKRLDELNIRWIRPKPIIWVDKNQKKRWYFPDFYLLDYDLYLECKSDYISFLQSDKVKILKLTIPNLKFLTSEEACRTFNLVP